MLAPASAEQLTFDSLQIYGLSQPTDWYGIGSNEGDVGTGLGIDLNPLNTYGFPQGVLGWPSYPNKAVPVTTPCPEDTACIPIVGAGTLDFSSYGPSILLEGYPAQDVYVPPVSMSPGAIIIEY